MRRDGASRRQFLGHATGVASALGVAGCLTGGLGSDDGGGPRTTTADERPLTAATDEGTRTATAVGERTEAAGGTDTAGGTETGTPPPSGTPGTTTESPRSISFDAPHGATIEATGYGGGDCGVVLVPQINMDRESWRPQAEMIAGMGHLALAIDEDPDDRPASVRGAVRYLRRQQDVSTVVLVGASTGGEAVVVANATSDVPVDGTIALSAAGGADRAPDLRGRSLFVVSTGDGDRFVRIARKLHRGAPEPKELVEYEGSAHGQGIFASDRGDDLRGRIRTVLSETCGN